MATDLTAWLDEREREARAATPGPWERTGCDVDAPPRGRVAACYRASLHVSTIDANADHIAAWSPDTALRVLRALRAAADFLNQVQVCCNSAAYHGQVMMAHVHGFVYDGPNWVAQHDELQAALDALPGAKP